MKLVLEDGEVFDGFSFGLNPDSPIVGEVVFNTGMVGYTEAITDPSYSGQILCFTYPLLGNYGVPDYASDEFGIVRNFESGKIQARGVVANSVADDPSHFESRRTISDWLQSEGITGIQGLDTRELTLHLRQNGVMMGAFSKTREDGMKALGQAVDYSKINFCEVVSTPERRTFGRTGRQRVALLDCGVKLNIVRNLVRRGFQVDVFPYASTYDQITAEGGVTGVVLSNGPGDPKNCQQAVNLARRLIEEGVPVLGICLGTQIIALSQGADTFKLKYGHRGQNKPCIDLKTGRCLVTSQNHGYSVQEDSLKGTELVPWFMNADDHTIEGLIHESKPCISVQFHPEASPGPVDATYVFDIFAELIAKSGAN